MKNKLTVIDIIAKETQGKRYKSHRYCHDIINPSSIEYEEEREVVWKNFGETTKPQKPISLKERADKLIGHKSIFTYFLDGSRHTYKVDDISYEKNVFPIIAGQIGVGCCKRIDKMMIKEKIERKMVIVVPRNASSSEWGMSNFCEDLLKKINKDKKIVAGYQFDFNNVLYYKKPTSDDSPEKKGIAVIQDYMVELEKNAVAELASEHKLNQYNWLIKDGSLEYKVVSDKKGMKGINLKDKHIKNHYKYVLGVSKSFNPTKCLVKGGKSNSDIIAGLKLYERTPAYMYQSSIAGNVYFVVWYIRIRQPEYTRNIFDGILKVEKIAIKEIEIENGVDTDLIDHISAHLINERNPVCYGHDTRWANHLYPIYLTEAFVKSKYISNNLFMQLF
ncbi:hypothetical protein F8154_08790 [Alkaliphilus pronyensis]|uniref:NurA domain-containing protein n=1 Tax=Alkaliphilus pronyensis TaxID=1482732 RepID=A0A6I0FAH8_9FIRM|nr:hypothetical protein [Alkaliphilus pronyensis]KAB3534497.1 hypothetical protein F8154_08790 [Alkaliphilus pronyensis]